MKCNYVEAGCNWRGTVATLKDHLPKCLHTHSPCPNGCKDSSGKIRQVIKKEMEKHLRECTRRAFKCASCGTLGTYITITTEHDKVCEKKVVSCLKCNIHMERKQLSMHWKVSCQFVEVPCKFESIGCETALKRKDMSKHEVSNEGDHLRLALDTIVSLKKEVTDLKQKFLAHKDQGTMIFTITDFDRKRRSNSHIFSPPFYTSPGGYKAEVRAYPNGHSQAKGTHISIFIMVIPDDSYNDTMSWPFEGVFTIELLNQIADHNHHCFQISFRGDTTESRGTFDFILHSDLSWNPAKNTQYLKDDTLIFRVSPHLMPKEHKPWFNYIMNGSSSNKLALQEDSLRDDHPLVFKMTSYSLNKRKNKDWYSKPFYSSPQGYKLCLKVYANGDQAGKGSFVSTYLKVLHGPYDSFLKWPVSGSVTFELLNQLSDTNHHKIKCTFKEFDNFKHETSRGKIMFMALSSLEKDEVQNTQYLLDDCLYFRVAVALDDHKYKPWLTPTHRE